MSAMSLGTQATRSREMTPKVKQIWYRVLIVVGTLLSVAIALGAERRWQ
jgi:hypothetical protein